MEKELESLETFYDTVITYLTNYSFQILGALIIMFIGFLFSKYICKLVNNLLLKYEIDSVLVDFISNLARFLIIIFAVIIALGKIGISIGPVLAAVGALSLTAGLALQGSVSNFAAGVTLIFLRQFKIGDTILVGKVYGVVEEVKLGYTILKNEDDEVITVPNKHMIGEVMVNSFKYRIVESTVGIDYSSEPEAAIKIIKELVIKHKDVSKEQKPVIGIEKFGDSSIDVGIRYWADTKNFFKVQYDINLKIFNALKKADISIPFPQRVVHLQQ
jgi:small conductance mechanosensitive channel